MAKQQSELLQPVTWLGGFPLVRWLLFSLVFGLVPIGTGTWLCFEGLTLIEKQRTGESLQELERRLFRLLSWAEPQSEVTRRAQFAARRFGYADGQGKPRSSFAAGGTAVAEFSRLRRWWGSTWDLYQFDRKGKLVTPPSILLRSRFTVNRLWNVLNAPGEKGTSEFRRYRNHFRVLFGGRFRLAEIRSRRGRPVEIRSRGRDGVLIWDRLSDGTGWIQIFWRIPTIPSLLRAAAKRPEFEGTWLAFRPQESDPVWLSGGSESLIPFLQRFDPVTDAGRMHKGQLWTGVMNGELLLTASVSGAETLTGWRILGLIVAALLTTGFLWTSYRWLSPGGDPSFTLRERLTFLLWFAITVPVFGVGVLGLAALEERSQVLLAVRGKQAQERLLALDADFSREFERRRRIFNEWGNRVRNAASAPEVFRKIGAGIRLETRDMQGRLMVMRDEDGVFMGMEGLFEAFSRLAVERNLRRLQPGAETGLRPVDDASRMIMESPEMGFVQLFDRPDHVNILKFAGNEMLFYWNLQCASSPAVYFMTAEPLEKAIAGFLHNRIDHSVGDRGNAFRLLVRKDGENIWYPRNLRRAKDLDHLAQRVRLAQQPMTEQLKIGGCRYRALALPGRQLSGHTLVALLPSAAMDAEMQNLRLIVGGVVLAALLLAGASGRRLAETLLGPLAELARGISAVRSRQTAFRVNIAGNDELARLGHAFNQMLENLKELDLARIVQEALLPKQLKPPPGWSLAFAYRSVNDLAGDYVDLLTRPDGKILVIIGDVTGHGVSSGLVMALIKAVVFEAAEESVPLPEVAERVNFTLHSVLRRRKLLTFFAGLLDPACGQFTFINAGQTYPFLLEPEGTVIEMVAPGFPLGLRADPRALEIREIAVRPGAALLFYTDGLVEACDPNQVQLGYERVQETLSECSGVEAEVIRDRLLALVEAHRQDRPLDDDLTLLVLRRFLNV